MITYNAAGAQTARYFYHADALGSVMALSNINGVLVEQYKYSAFGKTTVTVDGSTGNPYRFTARRHDTETGLYYYRARMYSPNLGRFLQTDPIGYADSMNLYQYCGNNPVNWIDPWGLLTSIEDPRGMAVVEDMMPGTAESINTAVQSTTLMARLRGLAAGLMFWNKGQRPGETLPGPGKGGPPNGSLAEDRGNGQGTIRDYGPDGKPTTDWDFGHDHGSGDPHKHDWNNGKRGPGEEISGLPYIPEDNKK